MAGRARDSGIGRRTLDNEGDIVEEPPQDPAGEPEPQPQGEEPPEQPDPQSESESSSSEDDDDDTMAMNGNQLNAIEAFEGKLDSVKARRFLGQILQGQKMFNWTDGQMAALAQTKMTGEARDWLDGELARGITYTSWDGVAAADGQPAQPSLKKAIEKRFGYVSSVGTAVNAVSNLTQKAGENVSAFYDRVSLAMEMKNYDTTDAQKEEQWYKEALKRDTKTYLLCGLRPEFRERVLGVSNPPEAINDILEVLRSAEREYALTLKQACTVDGEPEEETAETCSVERSSGNKGTPKGGGRGGGTGKGRGNIKDEKSIQCYYCKGWGHYQRNCQKRQNDEAQGRGRHENGQQGGNMPMHGQFQAYTYPNSSNYGAPPQNNYRGGRGGGGGGYQRGGGGGRGPNRSINMVEWEQRYEQWRAQEPPPPPEDNLYETESCQNQDQN